MSLTLFMHPLASFCHKVLIALYENDTPFIARTVDPGDPEASAELLDRWPVGKIPLLLDAATSRAIPESSVIIEYLDQHYPGPAPLLPRAPDARLEARLWDRFFDLYVGAPMQMIVTDRLRSAGRHDPQGVDEARTTLGTAHAVIDGQLAGKTWAIGESFTIADCAAAPALFYAAIVQPFDARLQNLSAYFERLMARPSVARTIREARPYFPMFPYRDAMPARFLKD